MTGRAAAAALLTALSLAGVAAAASPPTLRVVGRTPLVLEGRSFKPGEHVRVTVITGRGPRLERAVATGGVFRVTFAVPREGCGAAYAAGVVGDRGSVASITFDRRPALCIPPPRD